MKRIYQVFMFRGSGTDDIIPVFMRDGKTYEIYE